MPLTELTTVTGPGIHTQSNINSHNINSTGIITATKFVGDGSDLTSLPAGLGTAISADAGKPLNSIFYVNNSVALQDNVGDGDSGHVLNNNAGLTIGCSTDDSATSFSYSPGSGFKWGHARYYTKALSSTEVAKNWNATK